MNSLVLRSVALLVLVGVVSASLEHQWNSFKSKHGKSYATRLEESVRKATFASRKQMVEKFNLEEAEKRGFRLALNHMSDWTDAERKQLNGLRMPNTKVINAEEDDKFVNDILNDGSDIPDEVDWRKVPGRVTEVKNQGNCGSCWAFATTGLLEGQEKGKNISKLISLSEQDLVDCSTANQGCNGGAMIYALQDIQQLGGIESEKDYPYKAVENKCRFNKKKAVFTDKSGSTLPQGDEEALKKAVARYGPVSVGIDASSPYFSAYQDGVYFDQSCSSDQLDHGVLVVGYGTGKEGDYWIVKNSWGPEWGEEGYVRMARNKGNNCGIATMATIATF